MIHADGDTSDNRPWAIEAVFELWKLYYNSCGNPTGGFLHVCTDDENLEDADLKWCINEARTHGDHIGVALGECLLELTEEERETLYKEFWASQRTKYVKDWAPRENPEFSCPHCGERSLDISTYSDTHRKWLCSKCRRHWTGATLVP